MMRVFNIIMEVIGFILLLRAHIYLSVALDKVYFIGITIAVVGIYLFRIYKKVKEIKKIKGYNNNSERDKDIIKLKNKGRLSILLKSVELTVVLLISIIVLINPAHKIIDTIALIETGESDYYDNMKETKYENVTIIHNDDTEVVLPIIEAYMNDIKENLNQLLDIDSNEHLTVQIDYNKDVFDSRFSGGYGVQGYYYGNDINTIYLYSDDPVMDIIENLLKMEVDGEFLYISDSTFKDILFHEYGHHGIDEFLSQNNIDKSIPLWFEEGLAEYMTGKNKNTYNYMAEKYIPFEDLVTDKEWGDGVNDSEANVFIRSVFAIHNMVEEKGDEVIKDILLLYKEKDFNKALEEVLGYSLEELEEKLEADIKGGKFDYKYIEEEDKYLDIRIEAAENYILYDKNNIYSYSYLGNIYKEEDVNKAIELYKKGIESNPEEPRLYRFLGSIYEESGEYDLAKENFDKAEELTDSIGY